MPCVIALQGSMWQNMVVDTPQNSVNYFIFFFYVLFISYLC